MAVPCKGFQTNSAVMIKMCCDTGAPQEFHCLSGIINFQWYVLYLRNASAKTERKNNRPWHRQPLESLA